jgi:hypothetical protein
MGLVNKNKTCKVKLGKMDGIINDEYLTESLVGAISFEFLINFG